MRPLLGWVVVPACLAIGPSEALAGRGDRLDVLVLAGGDADRLAAAVEAMGGRVETRYRHVPALAAQIPSHRLAALKALAGVVAVEKDAVLRIDAGPRRGDERLRSLTRFDASSGAGVKAIPRTLTVRPSGYLNHLLSGAAEVWEETGGGEGSIVAVVDTGTHPVEPCLAGGVVIGAPGFPDGFDSIGDNPATARDNDPHGTWVAGVIGAMCTYVTFEGDWFQQAVTPYAPELLYPLEGGLVGIDLVGIAPLARLYPVKVFPREGGGTATSEVLEGLDHVLELKKTGALDVDVVNLSLGGPTLYDGRDTFDRFVGELKDAGILVVVAAGNAGPIPNSVGSPGTSFTALAAGATDEALPSRILYEFLGLIAGYGAGQGLVNRPSDETRIANFSGRGPASDGRGKPEIAALGTWNFVQDPDPPEFFSWVTGTSFAAPTVAGAAALLNAWWEKTQGRETDPGKIRNALLFGADPRRVGTAWRSPNDQGAGVLDVPAALARLERHRLLPATFFPLLTGKLRANVLGAPRPGRTEVSRPRTVSLRPAENRDFVFEIGRSTSRVTIELTGLDVPENSVPTLVPSALEVNLQSAKRSETARPIQVFVDRAFAESLGGSLTIEVDDGSWTFAGEPVVPSPSDPEQPMEPGLMKLSLAGDFFNEHAVGATVTVTRENGLPPLGEPVLKSTIVDGDVFLVPIEVPPGVGTATFDLRWIRDWSRFPTSDLDLILLDPELNEISIDGATLNAPERAVLRDPVPGEYVAVIAGFEVSKPDFFRLYLTLE